MAGSEIYVYPIVVFSCTTRSFRRGILFSLSDFFHNCSRWRSDETWLKSSLKKKLYWIAINPFSFEYLFPPNLT